MPVDFDCDVVVLGAGAAGLFCAGQAGQRGLKVLIIDHSPKVAEKIRISGGGRANFTNREVLPHHYLSQNPNFCRSALSRYTPQDFLALMAAYGVSYHEKHKGQLFCDHSALDLVNLLLAECDKGAVQRWQPCAIKGVQAQPGGYLVDTDRGPVRAKAVVVATGGLSIPKIGATGVGYQLAEQFGLRIVPTRPALVPLTFHPDQWSAYSGLAGVALPVALSTGTKKQTITFHEDLLFTHRGLSGPAVLQISSYWTPGQPLRINLAPTEQLEEQLKQLKHHQQSKKRIVNELCQWLPSRLADVWVARDALWQKPVIDATDKALANLGQQLQQWELTPSGTEGYSKAEVTAGGVDTRDLSSQTMESKQQGLYFIGEVVDVTGWLGGYNFQWAWSSGYACAQALAINLGHNKPQAVTNG